MLDLGGLHDRRRNLAVQVALEQEGGRARVERRLRDVFAGEAADHNHLHPGHRVAQLAGRLQRAGLRVTARLGSYDGDPWTRASETWLLIAERI